jgi:hypothetical protein
MVNHLFNLVSRAIAAMPVRIGSNWGGALFSFGLFMATQLLFWRFGNMKEHWRRNTLIALGVVVIGWTLLFPISVFLTAYDDHQNLAGAAVRLRKAAEKTVSQLGICLGDVRTKEVRISDLKEQIQLQQATVNAQQGTINTESQLFNGQQRAINECVVTLAKINPPEHLKIATTVLWTGAGLTEIGTNQKGTILIVIATTNKRVSPIHAELRCDHPIQLVGGDLATASEWRLGPRPSVEQSSTEQIDFSFDGAWEPETPLVFAIVSTVGVKACEVTQQSS